MGTSFRCSRAILSASTSTQVTSLPVSAKHAPATRPTYPLPITATCMSDLFRDCVARVHAQLRLAAAHPIVDRRVIGYDHDAVGPCDQVGRQLYRPELVSIFTKAGYVRVEIAYPSALPFQQADDVERRTLTDVLDVPLVRHPKH